MNLDQAICGQMSLSVAGDEIKIGVISMLSHGARLDMISPNGIVSWPLEIFSKQRSNLSFYEGMKVNMEAEGSIKSACIMIKLNPEMMETNYEHYDSMYGIL